ncbi:MAG: hypothetical protein U5J63_12470 [Fodinibius sp.]|nr:hypothetical protein [Fodinibius sp.]
MADDHAEQLQSIYVTNQDIDIPGWTNRTERLGRAQQPPIDWRPDGVDTLEWLAADDHQ